MKTELDLQGKHEYKTKSGGYAIQYYDNQKESCIDVTSCSLDQSISKVQIITYYNDHVDRRSNIAGISLGMSKENAEKKLAEMGADIEKSDETGILA